ncbi:hypothetical protein [Agrococcus sp. DT81.2]|uniref:hypothetical protein n=1 Tax=Agrococcus sp. DT81.2 TaxID=3393414 RepID=UPI003CE4E532
MRDQADDLDDAINDVFKKHNADAWVTEWVLVATTRTPDDQPGTSGYVTLNRTGMLHHHIRGLLDTADASTALDLLADYDDELDD